MDFDDIRRQDVKAFAERFRRPVTPLPESTPGQVENFRRRFGSPEYALAVAEEARRRDMEREWKSLWRRYGDREEFVAIVRRDLDGEPPGAGQRSS